MPFSRVQGERASPSALGILIPPGRRTMMIVRPRALDWDLLPVDPRANDEPHFWEVSREFAPRLAQEFLSALTEEGEPGGNRVEAIAAPDGDGYQVRAGVGRFVLIVCGRVAGQPYQPLVFESVAEACAAADRISSFLCPARDAEQEVYLNTRQFSR